MNHFNVLSDDLEATRRFYGAVLGLEEGPRPPFRFPGIWFYAGGQPILHVSSGAMPKERAGAIDHIAFSMTGLDETLARLKQHGIEHTLQKQTGTGLWQVFCHDPMGAKVELDFDGSERT